MLGMPLLITAGMAQVPGRQEIMVSSGVTDYVGVQPGAEATVEFIYDGAGEPIVERFDGLRLIGTFDMAGPDQGRFEPFWRFNARGQDVLTVRRLPGRRAGQRQQPALLGYWQHRVHALDHRASFRPA